MQDNIQLRLRQLQVQMAVQTVAQVNGLPQVRRLAALLRNAQQVSNQLRLRQHKQQMAAPIAVLASGLDLDTRLVVMIRIVPLANILHYQQQLLIQKIAPI